MGKFQGLRPWFLAHSQAGTLPAPEGLKSPKNLSALGVGKDEIHWKMIEIKAAKKKTKTVRN